MKVKHLCLTAVFLTSVLLAQDKPPLKLADSVIANIRTIQLEISNGNVQILQIQQQQSQLQVQYQAALASALKDSKLDPEKYVVDSNSLTVREKPQTEEIQKDSGHVQEKGDVGPSGKEKGR